MTKRSAKVSVRNNHSAPILAVGIVHKYSDNYKHHKEWAVVHPGTTTTSPLDVEYNTGAFTTGRDWWFISWYNEDMTKLYYSDPLNFRGIIDMLESVAPGVISTAAGLVTTLVAPESGPVAAAAAGTAAEATTAPLFNSESTSGFKQHILRAEDENEVTEIIVNADCSITIKSKSGVSNTNSSSRAV